ncbi:MAG: M9 family metallopeptidase N-terminal domain-containing protein, partial [Chloroflexi bacterium]|nr:M9 family metallopeptidase N-terminal domain-containing protein [Chloroflexota bacterium]
MQTVFLAIQERIPTYDGTYSGGLHQLWYFAHAAYYHEFFDAAVGPFTDVTRDHMISASRDFAANPRIYDQNDEAANILAEWLIDLDNPGVREHFIAPIKRVLQNMTPERGSSFTQLWAYNTAFFFLFRGIANNDQGYMDALAADGEMTAILEAAARYEYLYPDNAYLIENAIAELSRLAEIPSFREDVIAALSSILPV